MNNDEFNDLLKKIDKLESDRKQVNRLYHDYLALYSKFSSKCYKYENKINELKNEFKKKLEISVENYNAYNLQQDSTSKFYAKEIKTYTSILKFLDGVIDVE